MMGHQEIHHLGWWHTITHDVWPKLQPTVTWPSYQLQPYWLAGLQPKSLLVRASASAQARMRRDWGTGGRWTAMTPCLQDRDGRNAESFLNDIYTETIQGRVPLKLLIVVYRVSFIITNKFNSFRGMVTMQGVSLVFSPCRQASRPAHGGSCLSLLTSLDHQLSTAAAGLRS